MKQNLLLPLATAFLFMIGSHSAARAESSVIVSQQGAPLKILTYAAEFDVEDKKALTEHEVKYQNTGTAKIVSARFGILEYNGFNDLIDAFCGYTLESSKVGEKDSATFIDIAEHSTFFEDFGTGYIWVDAVRYEDGTLWKVDRTQILGEIQKSKPETSEADLAKGKCIAAD